MHDRSPCNVWGCLIWRNICHAQSAIRHYLRLVNRGHGSDMCGGNGRMGGGTSGRLLRNPIARRQVDVDFSDLLDHFALDRNTRGDSPLRRIHSRCAKVHVGGACSRAGKARGRGQVRPACARRQSGATHTGKTTRKHCARGTRKILSLFVRPVIGQLREGGSNVL